MVGRKIGKDRQSTRNLGFSYVPERDYPIGTDEGESIRGEKLIQGIDEIVSRERTTRSEIIIRALADYWSRHHDGNYQTLLPSYQPEGVKSDAQYVAEYVNGCVSQGLRELYYREVIGHLKDRGYSVSRRMELGKQILQRAKEAGIRSVY